MREVPTTPIEGQKTGTSGLRKKAAVFSEGNYLANWVQALFGALPRREVEGSAMVLGGDGRWFNKEASQIILKLAAGNGVKKMYCLLYTSPSPRDRTRSRMPSSA